MSNIFEIKIHVPDGHEIDFDNSTLASGGIVLKKKKEKKPTKWEELGVIKGYYVDRVSNIVYIENASPVPQNYNIWPTKKLAEASIALCQLVRFRDAWNEGWVPDWTDSRTNKYVICYFNDSLQTEAYILIQNILAFKSSDIRDEFLETFKDLLETAKPLL